MPVIYCVPTRSVFGICLLKYYNHEIVYLFINDTIQTTKARLILGIGKYVNCGTVSNAKYFIALISISECVVLVSI